MIGILADDLIRATDAAGAFVARGFGNDNMRHRGIAQLRQNAFVSGQALP